MGAQTRPEPEGPPQKLPFELHEDRQMSKERSRDKLEGSYMTGLPLFSSDPVRGQGIGVLLNYYENGKRDEALFDYQPYKYKVSGSVFGTTSSAQHHYIDVEVPYIFDTPYRIKAEIYYDRVDNTPYFGIGSQTMRPLSYEDRSSLRRGRVRNATFSEYEKNLGTIRPGRDLREGPLASDSSYHEYDFESIGGSFAIDRTFFGALRIGIDQEVSSNIVRTYDQSWVPGTFPGTGVEVHVPSGRTKVTEDAESGLITGLQGGFINYTRFGIMYDTRDFEPDPDKGIVLELNHSIASRWNASDYEFNKTFAQFMIFQKILPNIFEELVFASRMAAHYSAGNVPFFEYRYIWSIDGAQEGLGGVRTLRGYRQDRFVAPVMGWGNLELRWRFGSFKWEDNLFTFSLVPFYDFGKVWDRPKDMDLMGYAHSYGMGLRAIWNQATVILFDYGISREDRQFFIEFGHVF
jgi:outer membrane protein assembly factor BamA